MKLAFLFIWLAPRWRVRSCCCYSLEIAPPVLPRDQASVVEDGFVRRIKFGTTNTCNYPGAYWSKGFNDNECLEEYKSAIPLSGIVSNCGCVFLLPLFFFDSFACVDPLACELLMPALLIVFTCGKKKKKPICCFPLVVSSNDSSSPPHPTNSIPDPVESDTPCPADSFCQLADNFRRGLLQDDDDDQPWTVTKWLVYSVDIQVGVVGCLVANGWCGVCV